MRRSILQKEKSAMSLQNYAVKDKEAATGGNSNATLNQSKSTSFATSSANLSTQDGASSKISSRATSLLNLFIPSSASSSLGSVAMPFNHRNPSDVSVKSSKTSNVSDQEFKEGWFFYICTMLLLDVDLLVSAAPNL